MIDTRGPRETTLPTGAQPEEQSLDDLLIAWSEWSEDGAAVASLGELSGATSERMAALEAQVSAALPEGERARFDELMLLHRQRAREWGYSGVEFARRALVTLLR